MANIVHITFSMQIGGTENMLTDLLNEQAAFNQVSLIIVNENYNKKLLEQIDPKVEILFVRRKKRTWNPFIVFKVWRWLIQLKPDTIHCHQHNMIYLIPMWYNRTVVTIHDVGIKANNLNKYRSVYSISEAVHYDILSRTGVNSKVIANGIPIAYITCKDKYNIHPESVFKIVQIGRLFHEKKGQHLAIEALKYLYEKKHSRIQLYFIGKGPSINYLKELTYSYKLQHKIFFLGEKQRSWIYENLSQFDLLIQPSTYEGFGLTILEGLAAGLPVVASKIDGPAEILKDIPAGFLFDVTKKDALAKEIEKVIDLIQTSQITDLCNRSKELILCKYSIRQTALNYLRAYPHSVTEGVPSI